MSSYKANPLNYLVNSNFLAGHEIILDDGAYEGFYLTGEIFTEDEYTGVIAADDYGSVLKLPLDMLGLGWSFVDEDGSFVGVALMCQYLLEYLTYKIPAVPTPAVPTAVSNVLEEVDTWVNNLLLDLDY